MAARLAKRVLLIGWDAADWQVAAPLMDEGKMPHLERLVSQGVMGNISTLFPVLSPMLWTSIATGKRPHKHGIHGFAETDPRTGSPRPITSLGRKCKALWNICTQSGLKANVIGWWPSYPAEPIAGVMVSNHFQEANAAFGETWPIRPGSVWPPRLAEALGKLRVHPAEISPQQVAPFIPKCEEINLAEDHRVASFIKILAEISTIQSVATAVMQREPWDFMGVYFDGIDHFCHGFMKYHPPRLPWVQEEDFELYKEVINGVYQFHDMLLGVLLQLAGDDTTVILMSDHGFHSGDLRPHILPNEPAGPADEHRGFGMLAMRGPGLRKDELIHGANLLDITPTVLTLLGLPVGSDMDGRVLTAAFETPPEVDQIESWEEVPGEAGQHPPDAQIDSVDAHESLKQLVALGYIEKPDEDRHKAAEQTVRELRYNLARSYHGARMIPEAVDLLTQLWNDFPDEGRFGVKLFECQLLLSQTSQARQTLERLIAEKERYAAAAREELEQLKQQWKDRQPEDLNRDEQQNLRKLRARAMVNQHAMAFFRGSLLHAEGRYAEAIAELTRAQQVQVHNRTALYAKLGECALGLKQWDEAATWFGKLLEIEPVNCEGRLGLAQVGVGRKDFQGALEQATAAVGQNYHQPVAHYLCGVALRRLNRKAEALASLQTAVGMNSVFPRAHRLLSVLYRQGGQTELARRHRELARAAHGRIRAFQSGAPLPEDQDVALDVDLQSPARIGEHYGPLAGTPGTDQTVMIVSGLPRSGTSMMMQMLAAGGVPVLADGTRAADEDNPRGYLEYEAAKSAADNGWVRDAHGKVVKLVAQLLPNLPPGPDYRVIFMERNLGEVVASQGAMLRRQNVAGATLSDRRLAATYRAQINAARRLLKRHGDRMSVLGIDYHEALADPAGTARRVNAFLGGNLDEAAMQRAVDPSLRRQKR